MNIYIYTYITKIICMRAQETCQNETWQVVSKRMTNLWGKYDISSKPRLEYESQPKYMAVFLSTGLQACNLMPVDVTIICDMMLDAL